MSLEIEKNKKYITMQSKSVPIGRRTAPGGATGIINGVVPSKSLMTLLQNCLADGVLKLTHKNLSEVPKEVFSIHEINFDGKQWWNECDVTRLDLSFNEITVLPEEVRQLTALTSLLLSSNKLTSLPSAIFEVPLSRLVCAHNSLRVFPGPLCQTLAELDLSHNNLSTLPIEYGAESMFRACPLLQALLLSHNQLTSLDLPAICLLCPKLQVINLAKNALTSLGRGVIAADMLTSVALSENKLTFLPDLRCPVLNILDASRNALVEVPELQGVPGLVELHLRHNKFTHLPPIGSPYPSKLQLLDVSNNSITSTLSELTSVKTLKRLDVSNNSISQFDPAVGQLPLISFVVEGNPLRGLRREIIAKGTLEILKYLRSRSAVDPDVTTSGVGSASCAQEKHNGVWDLSGTTTKDRLQEIPSYLLLRDTAVVGLLLNRHALVRLPPEVIGMRTLRRLEVVDNQLTSLGVETLPATLECVDLSKNKLSTFPEVLLMCCQSLSRLNLAQNSISMVPESIQQLRKLSELTLSGNLLTELPHSIGTLKELNTLLAADNRIVSVPTSIVQLQALSTLSLANNDLVDIPLAIGTMSLRSLQLEGNRMKWLRPALLQQGTTAVLKYLKEKMPL